LAVAIVAQGLARSLLTQKNQPGKRLVLTSQNLSTLGVSMAGDLFFWPCGPALSIITLNAVLNAPGLLIAAWYSTAGSPSAHVSCAEPVPALRLSIRATPCERDKLRTLGLEHNAL
jgi:hypothetical protein